MPLYKNVSKKSVILYHPLTGAKEVINPGDKVNSGAFPAVMTSYQFELFIEDAQIKQAAKESGVNIYENTDKLRDELTEVKNVVADMVYQVNTLAKRMDEIETALSKLVSAPSPEEPVKKTTREPKK